ncbi:MAG TPA: hypothetical protein VGN61_00570 [Verrucomicrobiae bacterium]
MKIRELRILPPLAIGRLGSAKDPMDNYTLEDCPDEPLEFRQVKPAPTFVVNEKSGEIESGKTPETIEFKQDGRIRPVAPFLEVFALTDKNKLVPLTLDLLVELGLSTADLSWNVRVANLKVARRTGDSGDDVVADTDWFSSHEAKRLEGHCKHFISPDCFIDFGRVQFILPRPDFPEIRLRFTPAKGLIYGPKLDAKETAARDASLFVVPKERAIYDPRKGGWYHFEVPAGIDDSVPNYKGKFANETLPPSLFAIEPPAPCWLHNNIAISRGYLDDACDGVVRVRLKLKTGKVLEAGARICASPPAIVPDAFFVRTLADDLEQVIHGPKIPANEPEEITRQRAVEIVRRAFETVRFLNVAVMNGNPVLGREPLTFDTMPAEEAFDVERLMRPVVPEKTADTLAIMALHQQVFAALRGGAAPWFAGAIRRPEEAGDYTDHGRRKMPAMMCGADGNYLALTYRQINTIYRAAGLVKDLPLTAPAPSADSAEGTVVSKQLTPRNLTAQLHYEAAGNPVSTRPVSAVANCTPGLELDFRAVWRRLFEGIVLREYDNLVVEMESAKGAGKLQNLAGHRLLRVNGVNMMTQMIGPSPAGPKTQSVVLATDSNPDGVAPLEWSNALAHTLNKFVGKMVVCDFTSEPVWLNRVMWTGEKGSYLSVKLKVRAFFEPGTALISETLAEPGELTQGLCSPWQNDYRECSCYYWASARPDFVNVQPSASGESVGDNWMQKTRTGQYVADDYVDARLLAYDDLFKEWERYLRFQIGGRDAAGENPK